MKKFCDSLKEHAKKNWFWNKNFFLPLTRKESKSQDAKECYICGKGIQKNSKDKHYRKVRVIVIIQETTGT